MAKNIRSKNKNFSRAIPVALRTAKKDLLIDAAPFFRDGQMFQALRKKVFPKILNPAGAHGPIRIWVPGCSTGEEVYSLAISLFEFLGRNAQSKNIQIFATDISDSVLAKARVGIYPESIERKVSPEQLRRFFIKKEEGYQIAKFVRDCCVFARQNLIEDAPFSKVDLISCRNVLIYSGPVLQKKVVPIFHYALKKNGHLVLGGSEAIGVFSEMFTLVDHKNNIYARRDGEGRSNIEMMPHPVPHEFRESPRSTASGNRLPGSDLLKQVDRILLSQYAPAGVVINARLDVLQFRGQTSAFIEPSPGEASLNLTKLVRPDLLMNLRTAISQAMKTNSNVRRERIPLSRNGKIKLIHLQVLPLAMSERLFLVLFEEADAIELKPQPQKGKSLNAVQKKDAEKKMNYLRDELRVTKDSLQSIIEEQERTNQEIQLSNEKLHNANEELETAKEELQSTNEELTTLNEELQTRNSELSQANNDLNNLLGGVSMPILMLGNDLTIRRFTPLAERLFNLIPTDIGRRISDINSNLRVSHLDKIVAEVIDTLRTQEHEAQDRDGRWYSMRVRPYRTVENKIEGVVILLIDIDEFKRGLDEITGLIRLPLLTLRGDLRVQRVNETFLKYFKMTWEQIGGKTIYEIGDGAWNFPALKKLLEGVLPETNRADDYELTQTFPKIGRRKLLFHARRIYQQSKGTQLILVSIEERAKRMLE